MLRLGKLFLNCGKETDNEEENNEPDMDYEQDYDYITASFMSDYNIDLEKSEMHWWTFFNLLNGLSNSELGSCCILNRIRNLRNYDTSQIKDLKEKNKIEKAKEAVALKKRPKVLTEEQQRNIEKFKQSIGMA